MKRTLKTLTLITLATGIAAGSCYAVATPIKDVRTSDWYYSSVSTLIEKGGITGYDDGSFRPTGTITRAEYTAIVARSLGIQAKASTGGHWSVGIMAAATEAGLVKAGEFSDANTPITRYEMARMALRAVAYQKETVPTDYTDYAPLVSDLNSAGAYKTEVVQVTAMGIITGYPDKTFQGNKTLSRAEASAVVIRILDKSARKIPTKPSPSGIIQMGEVKPVTEFISNVSDLAKFNPYLKTVKMVTPESLGLTVKPDAVGNRNMWASGHQGVIVAIKDGKSMASFSGQYSPTFNQTMYSDNLFNGKIESFDYFGFYHTYNGTEVQLVANPWKE